MVGSNSLGWANKILRSPLYVLALTMIVPYYWMVIGAFKPVPEIKRNPPTFITENPSFNNFYDALGNKLPDHTDGLFQRFSDAPLGFWTYFLNSLFITITVTVLSLLIAAAAAYVLAKMQVPDRQVIFLIIIASMMVPWQVLFIPNFLTMKTLGWINSYWALIIPALPKTFAVFFCTYFNRP